MLYPFILQRFTLDTEAAEVNLRDLGPSPTALSQLGIAFRKKDAPEEIKKAYYGADT
jgi:hypothetical protein